ncbi:hypothetical protein RQP46_003270 [Phenoliferia psychrophenolica]
MADHNSAPSPPHSVVSFTESSPLLGQQPTPAATPPPGAQRTHNTSERGEGEQETDEPESIGRETNVLVYSSDPVVQELITKLLENITRSRDVGISLAKILGYIADTNLRTSERLDRLELSNAWGGPGLARVTQKVKEYRRNARWIATTPEEVLLAEKLGRDALAYQGRIDLLALLLTFSVNLYAICGPYLATYHFKIIHPDYMWENVQICVYAALLVDFQYFNYKTEFECDDLRRYHRYTIASTDLVVNLETPAEIYLAVIKWAFLLLWLGGFEIVAGFSGRAEPWTML